MAAMVKVKPAPGRAVRDPHTMQLLPADGALKSLDQFWQRRLRDKDVELVEQQQAHAAPAHHAPAPQHGHQAHPPATKKEHV